MDFESIASASSAKRPAFTWTPGNAAFRRRRILRAGTGSVTRGGFVRSVRDLRPPRVIRRQSTQRERPSKSRARPALGAAVGGGAEVVAARAAEAVAGDAAALPP